MKVLFSPTFSEFSFGYTLTEYLTSYMGRPNWAPFFPTTVQEKEMGIDVALGSGAIAFLLQFKRSHAVIGHHGKLKEVRDGLIGPPPQLGLPFYRTYLRGDGDREQHTTLVSLEHDFQASPQYVVRYAVPCFHTIPELDVFYSHGRILSGQTPIRMIRPSCFSLPHNKTHHISYDGISSMGYIYSSVSVPVNELESLDETINQINAAPFYEVIEKGRNILDAFAKNRNFDAVPSRVDDNILVQWFGMPPEGSRDKRGSFDSIARQGLQSLRNLLSEPVRRTGKATPLTKRTSLEYLTDFHIADRRCRQILGSPILISLRA